MRYVSFDTNLSTCGKGKTAKSPECFWTYLYLIILGLLFCEVLDHLLLMFICINLNYQRVVNLTLKFSKLVSHTIFTLLSIYIFSIAFTPVACILCLMVFQICSHALIRNVPRWLPTILILLSNDIHLNL